MWAEVTIRTRRELPEDLGARLAQYFHDAVQDMAGALEKTALDVDLLPQIVLARRSKEAVTLLLNSDVQTMKVYIDNSISSKTLDPLKREIDVVAPISPDMGCCLTEPAAA